MDWWIAELEGGPFWEGGLFLREGGGWTGGWSRRCLVRVPQKYGNTDRKSEDLSLTWDLDLT